MIDPALVAALQEHINTMFSLTEAINRSSAAIDYHLDAMIALLKPPPTPLPWWETMTLPGHARSIAGVTRRFRAPDLTAIQIAPVPDVRPMDVYDRTADGWLRVYPQLGVVAGQQWVRAEECTEPGTVT